MGWPSQSNLASIWLGQSGINLAFRAIWYKVRFRNAIWESQSGIYIARRIKMHSGVEEQSGNLVFANLAYTLSKHPQRAMGSDPNWSEEIPTGRYRSQPARTDQIPTKEKW